MNLGPRLRQPVYLAAGLVLVVCFLMLFFSSLRELDCVATR